MDNDEAFDPDAKPVLEHWKDQRDAAAARRGSAGCAFAVSGAGLFVAAFLIFGLPWLQKLDRDMREEAMLAEPAGNHELYMIKLALDDGPEVRQAITDAMQDGAITMGEYKTIQEAQVEAAANEIRRGLERNAKLEKQIQAVQDAIKRGDAVLPPIGE